MTNLFGLGWHLDRALFDKSLREAVSATGTDRYVRGTFTKAEKEDGSWTVTAANLNSGEEMTYHANWLIDATGRKASVARKV